MRKYLVEQFKKAKRNFDNIRSKVAVRNWNLASRLDQSHSRHEKKKGKAD